MSILSTSNDQTFPRRCPCGKIAHESRRAAETERSVLMRQDRLAGTPYKIHVYMCPCGCGWHMGRSRTDGLSRSRRRL